MKLKGSIKAICKCGATRFGLPGTCKACGGDGCRRKVCFPVVKVKAKAAKAKPTKVRATQRKG